MLPLIEAHRGAIELALLKKGNGMYPAPNVVMDMLVRPVVLDEEFDDGYSKPEPKSRLRDKKPPKLPNTRDVLNLAIYRNEIMGDT